MKIFRTFACAGFCDHFGEMRGKLFKFVLQRIFLFSGEMRRVVKLLNNGNSKNNYSIFHAFLRNSLTNFSLFGEMRGTVKLLKISTLFYLRRISPEFSTIFSTNIKNLASTHFSFKVPKTCTRFCPKFAPKK